MNPCGASNKIPSQGLYDKFKCSIHKVYTAEVREENNQIP